MKGFFVVLLMLISAGVTAAGGMNQQRLETIIQSIATDSSGGKGMLEFAYKGMQMYLLSDERHNRMRIIVPVIEYSKISEAQKIRLLESNFHSALDARYALSKGVLYSAYIHPLSSLSEQQIQSAVSQVYNLKLSFGNGYTSGLLSYGAAR